MISFARPSIAATRTSSTNRSLRSHSLFHTKVESLNDPPNKEHNLSTFIWSPLSDLTASLPGPDWVSPGNYPRTTVAHSVAVETTIIGFARKKSEEVMSVAREDAKSVLTLSHEESKQKEMFEEEDRIHLTKVIVEEVARGVTGFAEGLEKLVKEFTPELTDQVNKPLSLEELQT